MFSYYLNFRTYSDSCTSALYDTLVVSINYSVPFRRKAENFSYGQLERRDFLIVWGNSSMGNLFGLRERARSRAHAWCTNAPATSRLVSLERVAWRTRRARHPQNTALPPRGGGVRAGLTAGALVFVRVPRES
jgi:hypothetical protein